MDNTRDDRQSNGNNKYLPPTIPRKKNISTILERVYIMYK